MERKIRIRGARQHNLKGIDVDIDRRAFTVITGPSGSGKSSLAFDTLFAEGQRRYVESLSSYAKQFLERMPRPDVDEIDGLTPSVAIEQKNPVRTSRSTVGTATEVNDYLRLLWARIGETHCPFCDRLIRPDSPTSAADRLLVDAVNQRLEIAFPVQRVAGSSAASVGERLRAMGFVRVRADAFELRLDAESDDARLAKAAELLVIVDRLKATDTDRSRLVESLEAAFRAGEGEAIALIGDNAARLLFSERFTCPDHPDIEFAPPRPQLFSFNNPYGSCPTCTGFGAVLEYDDALIIPDASLSVADGAVAPWEAPRYELRRKKLRDFVRAQGEKVDTPWAQLSAATRKEILTGPGGRGRFQGVHPFLLALEDKRYKQYIRVFLRQYQSARTCPACHGARLRPEALYVKVDGQTIFDASARPLGELRAWIDGLTLPTMAAAIAVDILSEIRSRLGCLTDIGLGYLTLDRQTRTLSGGEAQRIHLANALGSHLVDTTYVLDEPSIGLHPRDSEKLLTLLRRLRDSGNTVVVVEHDPATIRAADQVIELGPASGERGGALVFSGTVPELMQSSSLTGEWMSGKRSIQVPAVRRGEGLSHLTLKGASLHNLHELDLDFPLGALVCITGVSGSGKSTLVHDLLYRALEHAIHGSSSAKAHLGEAGGTWRSIKGAERLGAVVLVDQSPIGRTPRSNPVTYVKAFDDIRQILADQPLARKRGWGAGRFSFNVAGGRCDRCDGAGHEQIEMVFLADVYVPCEACGGKRFKPETLEVTYRGRNVAEILELTVDEAIRFFASHDRLGQTLWHVQQAGLGYLRLGQPASTLSGGEAQRMKIARELAKADSGAKSRTLYILDEPTTGLHLEDVSRLLSVLDRLVRHGHTVLVIEHHLDVIKSADWVVDLGPEAGSGGGKIVASGPPELIAAVPESHTGRFLSPLLK